MKKIQVYCPYCGFPFHEEEWDWEYRNYREKWYCPNCDWEGDTKELNSSIIET